MFIFFLYRECDSDTILILLLTLYLVDVSLTYSVFPFSILCIKFEKVQLLYFSMFNVTTICLRNQGAIRKY